MNRKIVLSAVSTGLALILSAIEPIYLFAEESSGDGITIYTNDGSDTSYTYSDSDVQLVLTDTPEGTHFYGLNTEADAQGEWFDEIDSVDKLTLETREWKENYTYETDTTKVVDVRLHAHTNQDLYVVWQNNRTVTPYQMKDSFSELTVYANNGTNESKTISPMELLLSNGNLNTVAPEYSSPAGLYAFRGWNTKPDGTGVWYLPAYVYSVDYNQITELYANWLDITDALHQKYQTLRNTTGVRTIVQPVTIPVPVYRETGVQYVKKTLPVQTGVTLEWSSSIVGLLLASMGIDTCIEKLHEKR